MELSIYMPKEILPQYKKGQQIFFADLFIFRTS